MTEKEKEALQTFIIEAIDADLFYAYCDNCRFSVDKGKSGEYSPCDWCNRKGQNWGVSFSTAANIALKAIDSYKKWKEESYE